MTKVVDSDKNQKNWIAQWKNAALALQELKRRELQSLSEKEAVRRFNQLSLPRPIPLRDHSGLVDQQSILQQAHER